MVGFKNSQNRHGLRVTDLTIKRSTLRGKSNPPPAQTRDFETHHKALEFEAQFELKM